MLLKPLMTLCMALLNSLCEIIVSGLFVWIYVTERVYYYFVHAKYT